VQVTSSDDGTCQNNEWYGEVLKKCDVYLSGVILSDDPGKILWSTSLFFSVLVGKCGACLKNNVSLTRSIQPRHLLISRHTEYQ